MKILTFNILSEQYMDDTSYVNEYNNIPVKYINRKYRINKMIKVLKKQLADIILLQEVDIDIRKILIDELPNYKVSTLVLYMESEKKDVGMVTIIKKKLVNSIKHIPKKFQSTKVGYSTITCKMPDKTKLIIINIHLNSNKSNAKRIKEISELIEFIKTRPITEKIIIGGDFNTNCRKLHTLFTDMKLNSVVENSLITGTYLCESPMIDYIYVRGFNVCSGKVIKPKTTKYCRINIFKKYGSDHNPVIGIIK